MNSKFKSLGFAFLELALLFSFANFEFALLVKFAFLTKFFFDEMKLFSIL